MSTPVAWIGERPAPLQFGAILSVGICGVLIAGLQPLLLGALLTEGRMTAAQLGHAATAELLVMGAACAYAGARWRPERLRVIGVLSALLLIACNVATVWARGEIITLIRGLAGAPSGLMVWITIAMIARAPLPERWAGIYLTLQTLAQFATAVVLTTWVMGGNGGANRGFIALAVLCGVVALVATLLPRRFAPLVAGSTDDTRPSTRGFVALLAPLLWMACIVGVWVYLESLSRQAGHQSGVAGVAVSISLACQVLGGVAATLLANRLRWLPALVTCAVLDVVCLIALITLPSAASFLIIAAVFGFLWLFALPFLVPMVIAADPTRRAAVLVGGAELLGGSLGPLLFSFIVTDIDVRGAVAAAAVALVASLAIVLVMQRHASSTR